MFYLFFVKKMFDFLKIDSHEISSLICFLVQGFFLLTLEHGRPPDLGIFRVILCKIVKKNSHCIILSKIEQKI